MIRTDMANLFSPPSEMLYGTIGSGEFHVVVDDLGGGSYAISSTGTVSDVSETVKTFVQAPSTASAMAKGIFSNDKIDISGSGELDSGSHSNSTDAAAATRIWGSVEIWTGDCDSVGTTVTGGSANIHAGTARSGVAPIAFPELDFNYYYNIALANGQVRTGNQSLSGTMAPAGGVLWVNGNVDMRKLNFTGTLVATGNVTHNGQVTMSTALPGHPVLVSKLGSLDFAGGGTFNGMVYVRTGGVTIRGNNTIHGSIMAWGLVNCNGNWGTLDYQPSQPAMLGGNQVTVLAWER
jgi:hypothetical protein